MNQELIQAKKKKLIKYLRKAKTSLNSPQLSLKYYQQSFNIMKQLKEKTLIQKTVISVLKSFMSKLKGIKKGKSLKKDTKLLEEFITLVRGKIKSWISQKLFLRCHILLSLYLRLNSEHKKSNDSLDVCLKNAFYLNEEIFGCKNLYFGLLKCVNYFSLGLYEKSLKTAKKYFQSVFEEVKEINMEVKKDSVGENFSRKCEIFQVYFGFFGNLINLGKIISSSTYENFEVAEIDEIKKNSEKFGKKIEEMIHLEIVKNDYIFKIDDSSQLKRSKSSKLGREFFLSKSVKLKKTKILRKKLGKKFFELCLDDDRDKFKNKNSFYFQKPNFTYQFNRTKSFKFTSNSQIFNMKSSNFTPKGKKLKKNKNKILFRSNSNLKTFNFKSESNKTKNLEQLTSKKFLITSPKKKNKIDVTFKKKKISKKKITKTTRDSQTQTDNPKKSHKNISTEKQKSTLIATGCQTKKTTKKDKFTNTKKNSNKDLKNLEFSENKPLPKKNLSIPAPSLIEQEKLSEKNQHQHPQIRLGDVILANFVPNFSTKGIKTPTNNNNDILTPRTNNKKIKNRTSLWEKGKSLKVSVNPEPPSKRQNNDDGNILFPTNQNLLPNPEINILQSSPISHRKLKKSHSQVLPFGFEKNVGKNVEGKNCFRRRISRRKTFASMMNPDNKKNEVGMKMKSFKNKTGYFEFIEVAKKEIERDRAEELNNPQIVESEEIVSESESKSGIKSRENDYSLKSAKQIDLTKVEVLRKSSRNFSKILSQQNIKEKVNISIHEESVSVKSGSEFEIDDIKLEAKEYLEETEELLDTEKQLNCSLDQSWIQEVEKEIEENEDTRTALLFLQNKTKTWIRIFIKVKKWRVYNRRIYEKFLHFFGQKYIFLAYYETEKKQIRAELYCITQQFKPFIYHFNNEKSKEILNCPWRILDKMIIDVNKGIFQSKDDYDEGFSSKEKVDTVKFLRKEEVNCFEKQETVKRKKFKKLREKKKCQKEKNEDEFDIDIENNEHSEQDLSDYVIDLDENGHEIDE